jgi:hypothetical protein
MLADWISANLFQPLITASSNISRSSIQGVFVVALGVLGCTYLLSSLIRLRVVNPRNAIVWFLAGLIFFQIGPTLYTAMHQFRQSINSYFYAASIQAMESKNPFQKMAADSIDETAGAAAIARPCNNFAAYIPGAGTTTANGLDIALAYLKADGLDVLKGANPACAISGLEAVNLPRAWYDERGYFDAQIAPPTWYDPALTVDAALALMRTSTTMGFVGLSKLVNGLPVIFFGIVEQLVSLCLTVAFGLTFISFACAILFAFFERTEPIAWAVLDQWVSLIVQSVVIAIVQSMILALYISAANTSSSVVTLAIGVVGLVLMSILLWSAIKAIWSAFNRLFESFGRATGGAIVSTGQAGQTVVGAAAAAASIAVTGGAGTVGGLSALGSGATWAQAAGVAFGGSRALDGAAFSLARLPGLQHTPLGEVANQFVEGSAASRVGHSLLSALPGVGDPMGRVAGPTVGAAFLTDRSRAHEEAHLDEHGNLYWQPPMLRSRMNTVMGGMLSNPAWEEGDSSKIGRGGQPLRNADGEVFRREHIAREQDDARFGWGRPATFRQGVAPATESGGSHRTLSLDNSGNLDETLNDDFKRSLATHQGTATDTASGRLEAAAGKLEASASSAGAALSRAADAQFRSIYAAGIQSQIQQTEGRINISGANNVAEVLATAIASLQKQEPGGTGVDNRAISQAMAGALGISAIEREGKAMSPIERDVPRFQMFADQALHMGLNGEVVKQVLQEVKSNPQGELSPATRDSLISHQHHLRGESWQDSITMVQQLEHAARILPNAISAYGTRTPSIPVTMEASAPSRPAVPDQRSQQE